MQLPADRRAYAAARANLDPGARLAAMRQFLVDYPKSDRVSRANGSILDLLLGSFPDRTGEIDAQARLMIKSEAKGDPRINEETVVAQKLAEANIDLPLADKFSADAVAHKDEAAFDKATKREYAEAKVPLPAATEIHADFAQDKSEALAIRAEVLFHEGKIDAASAIADQAFAVDPTVDDTNSIRGEIALKQGRDADALDAFARAQLYGGLRPTLRDTMLTLYRKAHNDSDATFIADQDARYETLFPPPFSAKPHTPTTAGHTVFVELFTGSACEPCVAADLALDAMLEAYPRTSVIALSFDQHIPAPDPLANPDSLAHATEYSINHTPTYSVDGQTLEPGGGPRKEAESIYKEVAKTIDSQLAKPSAAQLQLTAALTPDGKVIAEAHATLGSEDQLSKEIADLPVPPPPPAKDTKPTSAKDAKPATATPVATVVPTAPALVLNIALVEDNIRYAGENGIRFHRMVVRSLAKPIDLTTAASATGTATFDPTAIAKDLTIYLDGFEHHNERFENARFLSKDTTIDPANLKVAAWVEDTTNHRVLQSAIASLAPDAPATATTGAAQ